MHGLGPISTRINLGDRGRGRGGCYVLFHNGGAKKRPLRPLIAGHGARTGPLTRPCANRQGADGLDVEMAQPMRSWPYWFQIGFLPFVNEV